VRLYLVRHPEPLGAAGVCYGRADLPVAPEAVAATAAAICQRLRPAPRRWVTSPAARCVALAEALAEAHTTDHRLVELDFGTWEGRRWDDLDRDEFDTWAADCERRPPPGGESWRDLLRRTAAFLADARDWTDGPVGVVTHAGVIRAALAAVLDIPLPSAWRIEVRFGGVVGIELGAEAAADRLASLA
jgi:alpha-ribazole phosphatase